MVDCDCHKRIGRHNTQASLMSKYRPEVDVKHGVPTKGHKESNKKKYSTAPGLD